MVSKKLINRTMLVVGIIFGVSSLLNYYGVFVDQGIYPMFEDMISRYRNAVHSAFRFLDKPLGDFAGFIAGLFRINVELQPYWKDVFIPMWLYLASLANASRADGRTLYRISLFSFGIIFALIFSVILSSQGAKLSPEPALTTLVVGVLLYEIAAYVLLMLLVRKEMRKSAPGFGRYVVEKPLTTITMGLFATVVFSFGFSNNGSVAALALIFFILMLGFRDMALAIFFAVENRGGWDGKFKDRLFRSKSWILGLFIVVVIAVATIGVAWAG